MPVGLIQTYKYLKLETLLLSSFFTMMYFTFRVLSTLAAVLTLASAAASPDAPPIPPTGVCIFMGLGLSR